MSKGLIHIYCGNGKGKTTCGMGLCVRAAGYGMKVLIFQFLKNNKSSERTALGCIPGITLMEGDEKAKFTFVMNDEEKARVCVYCDEMFRKVTKKAVDEDYDLLYLDEILHVINKGMLDENLVLDFLKNKPEKLEVILNGYNPSDRMIEIADYVSCIQKVKHPFERGIPARDGIER